MGPRRRFALVFNAHAGLAIPRLLDGVLTALRADGAEIFPLAARSAQEAAERVAEAAATSICDVVIAAGGDGTFRAVATGAAGTALPVGLIPLGTGNVLARELRLPRRASAVAELLTHGPTIDVQGGLANGAPFFLMCGAGFDGRVISGLNYRTKRVIGRAAFTRPVLRALSDGPQIFDVVVDGARFEASWAIAALASCYGGFTLTRDAGVGSDGMIAVIIEARTRRDLAQASVWLAADRMADAATRPRFVRAMPARLITFGIKTATPTQIDGDDAGATPVSIDRDGPTVRLIAPQAYALRVAGDMKRHANRVS